MCRKHYYGVLLFYDKNLSATNKRHAKKFNWKLWFLDFFNKINQPSKTLKDQIVYESPSFRKFEYVLHLLK